MIGLDKAAAIQSLVPNAEVVISDGVVVWINPTTAPVTDEQIAQELTRLQQKYADDSYKRNRLAEYPPMTNYIDGIVKGDQAQVQAYIDAWLAVKAKYPKP